MRCGQLSVVSYVRMDCGMGKSVEAIARTSQLIAPGSQLPVYTARAVV